MRDGPVVTPRSPALSAGRYSRKFTEESRLSSSRSSSEPLSLRAHLEQFLAIIRQRAKMPRREKPWVRTRVVLPRPGVPEGDNTGPKCRGLVLPEGDIADPNTQRDYRRVGTVGVGLFFGCSEGGFLRVSASESPSRGTVGSDSHHAPEACCSRKGTLQAQRAEDWCSQKGT